MNSKKLTLAMNYRKLKYNLNTLFSINPHMAPKKSYKANTVMSK